MSQADQEALWKLTASWLVNFTDPAKPEPEPLLPEGGKCPLLLQPLCKLYNETQCFAK